MTSCKNIDLLELSRDIFRKGTSIRFQTKGFSMRPFIRDGDFITVNSIKNSSVRVGDVAFYSTAENRVIVHRIIKKYKKDSRITLLIKGDATFSLPDKVDSKNVLGKVVAIERNGRKRNLETRFYRIVNLLFARLSPFSRWIYPIGSKIKQTVRLYGDFRRIK